MIDWTPVTASIATATITVPVDYDDPGGGDMELALVRLMADPDSDRFLFSNPGGPGGSGLDLAVALPDIAENVAPELIETYNLIGFDPRGVGKSSPLTCLDTAALDDVVASAVPGTEEGEADAEEGLETLTEGCAETNGEEASHVTTVEDAQDMEVIRQAIGAEELDYLGFSYGTFLGTTYAALFPDHVGRMVLDGALDPTQTPMESAQGQAQGFQTAFDAWAADCVDGGDCPVGSSVEDVTDAVQGLLAQVDADPLPTGDQERPLTGSLAFFGIGEPLYTKSDWPKLTAALGAALDGDGSKLLASADAYANRGRKRYQSNQYVAQNMVNALDCQIAPEGEVTEDEFTAESPVFGAHLYHAAAATADCRDLSISTDLAAPDYTAPGAAPILVVGTSRDPATPLVNSENLADLLESGVLLTRDGDGHTAYLTGGNACIDRTVTAYLVDGTVPADGTQC
ncbi:alpha/beta hydrolase [Nocardioides sp. GY 10113]|uniref:alpha/beta hydrolase n=1 Tax=Nocardioides sp. GY 10113 TaxID=2569761 RepID=UPI001457E813|nr:alpha/beta hydrolase [Nocardioides sp. GY 10113]